MSCVEVFLLALHFKKATFLSFKILVTITELNSIFESKFCVAIEERWSLILHITYTWQNWILFSNIAHISLREITRLADFPRTYLASIEDRFFNQIISSFENVWNTIVQLWIKIVLCLLSYFWSWTSVLFVFHKSLRFESAKSYFSFFRWSYIFKFWWGLLCYIS